MKRHILLLSTLLLSGTLNAKLPAPECLNTNLPGTFPDSGVFKGKYVKHFQSSDVLGTWMIIANDRINRLTIQSTSSGLIMTSRSGKETFEIDNWVPYTGLLEFTRTVDKSPKENIVQKFTGYLMEYPDIVWAKNKGKKNTKDYKWRMAGIFMNSNKSLNKQNNGWYATRPRK